MGRPRPRPGRAIRGGSFYYYVVGVHFQDRAMSRSAALAFLVIAATAVVFFVRILL